MEVPSANTLLDFQECINEAGLQDFHFSEPYFTSSNSGAGANRILCKLDRALARTQVFIFRSVSGYGIASKYRRSFTIIIGT